MSNEPWWREGVREEGLPTPEEIRTQGLWREMGLREEEYARIQEILGRLPNYTELGMYAVLWSEHCAYKHSRPLFKLFPTQGKYILQGIGENAGIIDIGDGLGIAMKVESHNHPSAVEPYQGAATGVGGILRDIFTMGARPIANLNSLRFGPLSDPRVRYLFRGVVAGIGDYGNCTGVPTVAGEVYFDECYTGNCLVNAMAVGLVEHKHIATASASGVGNAVMVVGARTGRDGIHGATFASEELSEKSEAKRPSVQVGDPFTEKLLIEACLEVIQKGYVVGIQDMGAAGLTSSAAEMASRAGSGIEMDIALVPRREPGLTSYDIMLSESQERMLVVPKRGCEEAVAAVFKRWGLQAVVVGRVTDDGMLRVREGEKVRAEVPAKSLSTEGAPTYHPPAVRPAYLDKLASFDFTQVPVPQGSALAEAFWLVLTSPNLASKEWVYTQYDHMVQVNTVAAPGAADAAVLRIKGTRKGIALTIDGNGRYCYLNPRVGGAIAVAEAARNLVATGAEPMAITDGLNFGNPEKPEVFWQFREAVEGMSEACRVLETPVISGNVSFYNETKGEAIYPTPIIGMVGLLPEVERYCTQGFKEEGDLVVLLGETKEELSGSEYLKVVHGVVAGTGPSLDLEQEKATQGVCLEAIRAGLLSSAHDVSEGGLAIALAESCISGGIGAQVQLLATMRVDALLFGESQSRFLLSLPEANLAALQDLAHSRGVPLTLLGRVGGDALKIKVVAGETDATPETAPVLVAPVAEMTARWRGVIGKIMAE